MRTHAVVDRKNHSGYAYTVPFLCR
jgi:hypothetical protein